jgi:hypothetical protein
MSPLRPNIRRPFREYERMLGPAVLYLDDLEAILDTVREAAKVQRQANDVYIREAIEKSRTRPLAIPFGAAPASFRSRVLRRVMSMLAGLQRRLQRLEQAQTPSSKAKARTSDTQLLSPGPVVLEVGDARADDVKDLNRDVSGNYSLI